MGKATQLVKQEAGELATAVRKGAVPVLGGLGSIWAVSVLNWVAFSGGLTAYGVQPWTMSGLAGIFAAPFLHLDMAHLLANTTAFLMLAPLTMLRKRMDFWVVTLAGGLTTGMFKWVLGGVGTVHVGASGVIYAYLGFVMARGLFQRSWGTLALSAAMFWMFSGLLWGAFPFFVAAGISWQGHLGGLLGGALVAWVLGRGIRAEKAPKQLIG